MKLTLVRQMIDDKSEIDRTSVVPSYGAWNEGSNADGERFPSTAASNSRETIRCRGATAKPSGVAGLYLRKGGGLVRNRRAVSRTFFLLRE